MSTRPGFPDLTDSHRRALMRLLVEARVRLDKFAQCIPGNAKMSKREQARVKCIMRADYRSLEHQILVQFPECRDTWPYSDLPEGKSLCKLRKLMRDRDSQLAELTCVSQWDIDQLFAMWVSDHDKAERAKV